MKRQFLVVAAIAMVAACDSTEPNEPGTITAVVVSPAGAEGAAVLDVNGTVESFTAPSDVTMFTTPAASGTRVILVRSTPGELSVNLTVPDVGSPPTVSIVEVAGGDDQLRASLTGYQVSFR